MTERDLFMAALQIENVAERVAYLDQACGDDTDLRHRVDVLLRAIEQAGSFLQQPAADVDATSAHSADERHVRHDPVEVAGTCIGPYKLVEVIGEGGMGTVWMAQQTEPVKRLVAVKLIRAGMDSKQVIARFEAERQALALMDHPNIAKVHDAGTTPDGRPYFVMELVKGLPITKYCDEQRLTPRQRLELFIPVCQAVQHAHQKGIIHRDLKPSNVLVAPYDSRPVVKVIDFGIAKAAGQPLTDRTLVTGFGSIVGTLEYMSPEQAELNNQDVDTRSDIYSLGVLLYELLTGTTPLNRARLEKAAFTEILRVIREVEPPKPSTRLSESKDSLPSISAQRHTEPARLSKLVRGDIDWIAMKALEKDRNRRYETANGFAADIQRYLADEAVQACPPSAGYRLRKFARRNKVALITSGLVAAALLIGTAVSAWQAVEATRARHLADERMEKEKQARINEEEQRRQADAQRKRADERRRQAKATAALLESVFKNLDPREESESGLDVKERLIARLNELAAQLDRETLDPLTQAGLHNSLGDAFLGLNEVGKAVVHFKRALAIREGNLGPNHPETLTSMNGLAEAYLAAGNIVAALPLCEKTLERRKAALGEGNSDTLVSMNSLASAYQAAGKLDQALPLFEQTLAMRKTTLGIDHPQTVTSMTNLAGAYQAAGKFDLALPLLEQCFQKRKITLGLHHPATLLSMSNLAKGYRTAGKLHLALPLFEQALDKRRDKLGTDHPLTLVSMNDLASCYLAGGNIDQALPLFEQALEKRKARLGANHPDTLLSMNNLGVAYQSTVQFALALPLFEQALEKRKARLGADHPDTLFSMAQLARCYLQAGKVDLAVSLFGRVVEKAESVLGPGHPNTLTSMNYLADCYWAAGNIDLSLSTLERIVERAKTAPAPPDSDKLKWRNNLARAYVRANKLDRATLLFEQMLEEAKAEFGPHHPTTLSAMNDLAVAHVRAGKTNLALSLFQYAVAGARESMGLGQPNTQRFLRNLIDCHRLFGQYDHAEPLWRDLVGYHEKNPGANQHVYANDLTGLGLCLLQQHKYVEAEQVLRESLKILEASRGAPWDRYDTMSMLGGALLGQKKYAEAGPLLLKGFEGMKIYVVEEEPRFGVPQLTFWLKPGVIERVKPEYPAYNKVRLTEALERLVRLYDAIREQDHVPVTTEPRSFAIMMINVALEVIRISYSRTLREARLTHRLWQDLDTGHQERHQFIETTYKGTLSAQNEKPVRVIEMKAGHTYIIDLESRTFAPLLILEAAPVKTSDGRMGHPLVMRAGEQYVRIVGVDPYGQIGDKARTFTILENGEGFRFARDGDRGDLSTASPNSRIVYTAHTTKTTFQILAMSFHPGGTGPYVLRIRELVGEK